MPAERRERPLVAAAIVLGLGMGGFADGILFHQLLQVHAMLSARIPKTSLESFAVNMFWDGVFHATTWLLVAIGLGMLWKAGARADVRWSGKIFCGGLLLGWGIFNLVEGVLDHHVLHLHHVVEAQGVSIWDWAFLASGVVLGLSGIALIARGHRESPRLHPTSPQT